MMRSRSLIAIATAVGVLTTACSVDSPDPVTVPIARRVEVTTTTARAVAPIPCTPEEAVKSYRPSGSLPTPGNMPAGSYMQEIFEHGKLILGTSADVLQFGARNPIKGGIEGFDVDMAHEVAAAIFGDFDRNKQSRLEFKIINYAQRIPSLRDDSVNMVAHTMTINCTRWTQIAFSSEYYRAGQKILVRQDSKRRAIGELDGDRVCVAKGSTNIEELQKYPTAVPVPVDDLGECLVLFQQGSIAAIIGDDTVLAGFAAQDPYAAVVGEQFTQEPYGLGIKLEHRDFVEFVNLVLERMRADGTWDEIYCRWLPDCSKGRAPVAPPAAVYGR